MSGTTNDGGMHTGVYDPALHDNQIVAIYETEGRARAARDALVAAGIPTSTIQVLDRDAGIDGAPATDEGFWGAIKGLFAPEEETSAYNHAINRGHAMLVVMPTAEMDRARIIQVLEETDPIDFDAKLAEWRESGYDYTTHPSKPVGVVDTAVAAVSSAAAGVAHAVDRTVDAAHRTTDLSNTETVKVMEERLNVGKREVSAGAVRVRSYVVERPVEEQVRLHEERIIIERRPVDRVALAGEVDGFKERVIEARATAEEAVISKTAHVVEEIGIRKDVSDRTETVRDTVRKTEVEVVDTTAKTGPMVTEATVTDTTRRK